MTEEERALTIPGTAEAPAMFGDKNQVLGMANRLAKTAKFVKEFNYQPDEILWAANICVVMNLNPWRGEAYFWRDWKGQPVYSEGYKILVRWAQDRCLYDERVEPLPLNDGEAYKFRCFILRHDKREGLAFYKEMGASWREAFETVADWADGVVLEKEMFKRDGGRIDPPKGWTWEQKARIRSLKAALRLSHGAPTLRELSEASYQVNGVKTKPVDWEGSETLSGEEAAALAKLSATTRKQVTAFQEMTGEEQQAKLKENTDLMRAPEDFEGFGDEVVDDTGPADRQDPATEVGQLTTEEVKLTHEQVAASLEKIKAERAATPPGPPGTQDQPVSQKRAVVLAQKWNVEATAFCQEEDYYNLPDGAPNWPHLTAAAFIMGYPEITDANLKEVIEALGLYAEDQQALASENEATSKNIDAELIYGVIEGGEAMQDALDL